MAATSAEQKTYIRFGICDFFSLFGDLFETSNATIPVCSLTAVDDVVVAVIWIPLNQNFLALINRNDI